MLKSIRLKRHRYSSSRYRSGPPRWVRLKEHEGSAATTARAATRKNGASGAQAQASLARARPACLNHTSARHETAPKKTLVKLNCDVMMIEFLCALHSNRWRHDNTSRFECKTVEIVALHGHAAHSRHSNE